jgi:hypothetical protein
MKFAIRTISLIILLLSVVSSFKVHAAIVIGSPIVNVGGTYNSLTNTFVACQEQQIIFVYNCYSTNNESITVNVATSNLSSFFPAGSFSIFPVYPYPNVQDIIDVYVSINTPIPTAPYNGIYNNLNIGLVTATESATIEFNLLVPGAILSASDTEFCANTPQSIQLSVNPNSNDIALDLASINWTGPASAQIINPSGSITMVNIDPLNQFESITFTCSGNTQPDPVTGVVCSFTNTLTVSANLNGNNVTQTITACDSYTWIDGVTYFFSNNTATHLLSNSEGCDSLINLDLTIFTTPMVDLMFSVAECDSFILPILSVGNYYTESGGMGTLLYSGESISTTQDLYIYAANGQCSDENNFSVIINESPDNGISQNGLTLSANATGANYVWVDCNNALAPISGETAQTFIATQNGSYAVQVSTNGCEVVSDCVDITTVSLGELTATNLIIYPNPSEGVYQIESEQNLNFQIKNLQGQIIYSGTFSQGLNTLDLSDKTNGIYVLVMGAEKVRIVKQ